MRPFSWLRATRPPVTRPSPRTTRLGVLALEDRITPDARDIAGLRFNAPGTFVGSSSNATISTAVEVGLVPAPGDAFVPLLSLPAGVTVSTSPASATIKSTLSVRGLTFTGNNLAFVFDQPNNKFAIAGDSSFTAGGVTIGASFGSAIGTPGLVIQSGELASVDLGITTSFSYGSVSFNTQDLRLQLDMVPATSTRYAVRGGATAKVAGQSGPVLLSTRFGDSPFTPGLVVVNGALTELAVGVTDSFPVGEVTLKVDCLIFRFDQVAKSYGLFGSATASVSRSGVLVSFPLVLGGLLFSPPGLSVVGGAFGPFETLSLPGTPTITQPPGVVQPAGTVLPILTADTLQDTFTDLPEGALAKGSNQAFRVSYANNKVTLTAAPTGPFVVDNPGDTDDGNYAAGQRTLREAIQLANAAAGADTITFAANLGDIVLTSSQLAITDTSGATTITGPTTGTQVVTRSAAGGTPQFRIFEISDGVTADMSGLTISNGDSLAGGGIFSEGTLTLSNSTISKNTASEGGGIITRGELTLRNSTVAFNTAESNGGGIHLTSGSRATVTNSTLSGNTATGNGGGILNFGTVTLTNSTLTGNTAGGGGGIFSLAPMSVELTNTIVAGNFAGTTPNDLSGSFDTTSKNNLIGNAATSGGLTNGTDGNIVGVAVGTVLNTTLGNNGGPTQTHALLAGSPALDKGDKTLAGVPTQDQRGLARVSGPNVDIGAVEFAQRAGPYVVDNAGDGADGDLGVGKLTLREAVLLANDHAGADTITFAAGLGTVTLTAGELFLTDAAATTIDGGAGVTVLRDATAVEFRLFNLGVGATAALRNLTVSGGKDTTDTDTGGISNQGSLSITNVTISGNVGGGITSFAGATLAMTNATISGNKSQTSGGGIANLGTLTLMNVTITGNTAVTGTGGLFADGVETVTNTIIAGNLGGAAPDDVAGTIDTGTTNLIGGAVDTVLNPTLANNGGPTFTHALLAGSKAFDAGTLTGAPATDQRGFLRPGTNSPVDIGAFEVQTIALTPSGLPTGRVGIPYGQAFSGTAPGLPAGTTFTFTASNVPPGLTLSAAGVLSGTPTGDTAVTILVTVTASTGDFSSEFVPIVIEPNRAPVAVDDSVTIAFDTAVTIDVLANDSDPDGNAFTISTVGAAAKGSTAISNG